MATENKSIVRRLYEEVWNKRKLDLVDELISPSHALHDANTPGSQIGPVAYKQQVVRLTKAFPDLHFEIHDMLAEGELVAFRSTMTGTHHGPFQGRPPTGKQVSVAHMHFVRLINGKASDLWHVWDTTGLMRQLGAAAPQPQAV